MSICIIPNVITTDRYSPVDASCQNHWNYKLFLLQENAPKPRAIQCAEKQLASSRPDFYGDEFHGAISREASEALVRRFGEGSFLVRESGRAFGAFTLCFLFDGLPRNYKLYYDDRQHFVGEKRFDSIRDLVADGLITLYLEKNASDYILRIADDADYEASPYRSFIKQQKRILKHSVSNNTKSPHCVNKNCECKEKETPICVCKDRTAGHDNENVLPLSDSSSLYLDGARCDKGGLDYCRSEESINVSEDCSPSKQHDFKVHTFRGANWCDFCRNFLWGLVQQGKKCSDCGFSAHKKCSVKVGPDCVPDLKYVRRLFGVDLTTLSMAHHCLVPVVVEKCVAEVDLRGLASEGIYRVPGSHEDIEALRGVFDRKGDVSLSRSSVEDINIVAGLLKLYLRMLPIPLVPYSFYDELMRCLGASRSQEQKVSAVRGVVAKFPAAHFHTLSAVLAHLRRVAANSSQNRMSTQNLALIFFPTLLRSSSSSSGANLPQEQFLVETMIADYDRIFAT